MTNKAFLDLSEKCLHSLRPNAYQQAIFDISEITLRDAIHQSLLKFGTKL